MESNETTQLQKAILIANKDGFDAYESKGMGIRYKRDKPFGSVDTDWLWRKYTTDLNYLMPLAVKVRDEINVLVDDAVRNNKYEYLHVFHDLSIAYNKLTINPNSQYTELFEALFNAIKLLEA